MKPDKKIVVALFGKSGAGKDSILKYLSFHHTDLVKPIVHFTTRPPREYEEDGVDYYFIDKKELTKKVAKHELLECSTFREWHYGTALTELSDKINIGVFNIQGIETLLKDDRVFVVPVYIMATDKTRLLRCLTREEHPDCREICRRFFTDEEDFETLSFPYMVIENDYNGNLPQAELKGFWASLISYISENLII